MAQAHQGPPAPAVRGWEACRRALTDPRLTSDPFEVGLLPERSNNMLLIDGPEHAAVRRLVAAALAPSRLGVLAPALQARCDDLVAEALGRDGVDLMAAVVEPLVLHAVFEVVGVPDDLRDRLAVLVRAMLGLLDPDAAGAGHRRAVNAALRATMLFERQGRSGRAAGLHRQLEAAAADGAIPVKLARSTPVVVLHGGYENPRNQLGCLLAWAASDPGAAAAAGAGTFDDVMRSYAPMRAVARWARADTRCSGGWAQRGDVVWVDLESAGLDAPPTAVAPPGRPPHLGFGFGRHACPGAALARLQGEVVLAALRRVPPGWLRALHVDWEASTVARGPRQVTAWRRHDRGGRPW